MGWFFCFIFGGPDGLRSRDCLRAKQVELSRLLVGCWYWWLVGRSAVPRNELPHPDNNGAMCLVPSTGHSSSWSTNPLDDCLLPIFQAWYCLLLNSVASVLKYLNASASAYMLFPNIDALISSMEKLLTQQNDLSFPSRFLLFEYFS